MLPSVEDWLSASWADYKRRWAPLMGVIAVGFVATMAAMLLPILLAVPFAYSGAVNAWLAMGAGWVLSTLALLAVSTWAQAAAIRAASFEEPAFESLREGWRRTPAFAWVLSLATLAIGGALVLLIVPGLAAAVLLFFAVFYQMSGEDSGMGAVELSFARVRPHFWAVASRLLLLATIAWAPSWIPWIGWLLGLLLAPFMVVAVARLAGDLKTLAPAPERPSLGVPVAALSAILLLATVGVTWAAARTAFALGEAYASGQLPLPDAETAQAMRAVLEGTGTEADSRRATDYILALSSATAAR